MCIQEEVANEMQALEQRLEADKHEAIDKEQRNNSILSEQLTAVKKVVFTYKTCKNFNSLCLQSLLAECNEKDLLKAEKVRYVFKSKILSGP